MEAFLDYIEKYKFAIVGTALVHVLFFFYANFTTVDRPFKFPEQSVEISVPLDDIEIDEKLMEQMQMNQNQQSEQVYNMAADANDNREKSYENYSTQEMDQQVEQEAKALEQQYFDEWAATHQGETKPHSGTDIETEEREQKRNNQNVDKSTIKTGGANAFAGSVLVEFYLPERSAHSLPKPGYTCNSSGTVVIDVRVDKAGYVKSADYNSNMSRGATECMIEKAVRYAKRSRFNFKGSASNSQNGTITYKFVAG